MFSLYQVQSIGRFYPKLKKGHFVKRTARMELKTKFLRVALSSDKRTQKFWVLF